MSEPTTDRALVTQTLSGNTHAYGELVSRYQQSVFAVCYRLLGERRDAEDLTQEAFLRAHAKLRLYDAERPFGPWVRRVASNLTLNHLKRKRPTHAPLDEETDRAPDDANPNPEQVRAETESAERIQNAILELAPHYRVVLEMRHFQHMAYDEIATALNLPLSTVKSHLFRARKQLAQRLTS